MTAGINLVDRAATFVGQRYSTDPGRDNPDSSHKDCSGLIAASYLAETGNYLGANVSVTIYDLCMNIGQWIHRDDAKWIAGSCLLMPEDPYKGWGPLGHIGFSDGSGGTVEATPPRVQRLSFDYQPWGSNACLLPGIDYSNAGHGGGTAAEELFKEIEMFLVRNTDLPEDNPNNWFLITAMGVSPNIPHERVWNMAAYQGFETKAMTGGEIFALAVDLVSQRSQFVSEMKAAGVGGSTVVEKPVLVPADVTTLSNQALIDELERRILQTKG